MKLHAFMNTPHSQSRSHCNQVAYRVQNLTPIRTCAWADLGHRHLRPRQFPQCSMLPNPIAVRRLVKH